MHNLVVVPKLFNAGCRVIVDPTEVQVCKEDRVIVQGWQDNNTWLWKIPIVNKTKPIHQQSKETTNEYANAAVQLSTTDYTMHMANSVYDCSTQEQITKFLHITMFSSVKMVLLEAARRKCLQGWPGFTQAAICKKIDVEEDTVKGHLKQTRQGIQSTKLEEPECVQQQGNLKTNFMFAT
eukprot:1125999-Ditylum_brightwellii.AAC.1